MSAAGAAAGVTEQTTPRVAGLVDGFLDNPIILRQHMSAQPDFPDSLTLPPQYELVTLDTVDSALLECRRRASVGADEGTLIRAREQTSARGRFGQLWQSPRGNLYCAVLLRPEFPAAQAGQLVYVAAVSAGTALAGLISPMAGLRYRWPNDIVMNDGKVGAIHLDAPAAHNGRLDWLTIGLAVNIESYPKDTPFPALSVHAVDGSTAITPAAVLEDYARYLLSWLNRWADNGFESVLKAWTLRADDIGDEVQVQLSDGQHSGKFLRLNDEGAMILAESDGTERVITIGNYFDLDFSQARAEA